MAYLKKSGFSGSLTDIFMRTPAGKALEQHRQEQARADIPLPPPTKVIPEDPADYQQDPACPEGQRRSSPTAKCEDDPIYIELMQSLNRELRELEEEEKEAEKLAQLEEQREQLRIEQEKRRVQLDRQRQTERIQEEQQIKKIAILGIGGLGVLTIVTLIFKLIFR